MQKFLFSMVILFSIQLSAQTDYKVENDQLKVNFLNPGLEYEVGISKDQTLDFGIGLQFGARGSNDYFRWALIPAVNVQYRYYYNLDRRMGRGKSIAGNSGNYIALANTTFLNETIIGNLNVSGGYFGFAGPVYGIQRTYPRGFNFNLKMGVGYYYDDFYDGVFGPTLGFSVGWVIGKNRK